MSYLIPPRLNFFGNVSANPPTTNNNDLASVYDVDTMTLNNVMRIFDGGTTTLPAGATNTFDWNSVGDNLGLRQWLMGLMQIPDSYFQEDDLGGLTHGQMAHWNYYGDHDTQFPNTTINSAVLASGQPAAAGDDALKLQVSLNGDIFYGRRRGGSLVDADPTGLITSQIFSGQFLLSLPIEGGGSFPVLIADHPTTAYSYIINPNKNLNSSCEGFESVSSIFQFGLKNENLTFVDDPVFHSPAMNDLKQQARQGLGLMVRFCFYDAVFNIQAIQLNQLFNGMPPQYVYNPYYGSLIGTIGVWNADEISSAPVGRKLRVQVPYQYPPQQSSLTPLQLADKRKRMHSVSKYRARVKTKAGDPSAPRTARLGGTMAHVNTALGVVTLDWVCTFPEADTVTREKVDLGPLSLVLLYGVNESQSVTIGVINDPVNKNNSKAIYESSGGVFDVSYANSPDRAIIEANIATGRLAIVAPNLTLDPVTAKYPLMEIEAFDVQTENRVVYFDAGVYDQPGGTPIPGTSQITIQVLVKGVAPTTPTQVNLEYWMCQKVTLDPMTMQPIPMVNPDRVQVPVVDPYFTVAGTVPQPPTKYFLGFLSQDPMYPGGNVSVTTEQVTVPAGGQLTLNLTALPVGMNPSTFRAGVSLIRFTDPANPVTPNFAWDNCDYATVRILPFDDYSQVPDATINNWSYIYSEVFGFYSVLYPVMSKVIPWGPTGAPNNPAEVKQFASQILALTDFNMWNTTIYMPITRDLSGGKRELLRRWCNLQQ